MNAAETLPRCPWCHYQQTPDGPPRHSATCTPGVLFVNDVVSVPSAHRMRLVLNDGGRADAGFKGTAPGDCVTRAIAIATGEPYRTVYDALNAATKPGRRRGKRGGARTGVPRKVYEPYLRSLGWVWVPVMKIGSGCTMRLASNTFPQSGRYIARLSGHLCAVVDGIIHDTYNPDRDATRCVYGYFTKGA